MKSTDSSERSVHRIQMSVNPRINEISHEMLLGDKVSNSTKDQMPEQTDLLRDEAPEDYTTTVPILPVLDPAIMGVDQTEDVDRDDAQSAPDDKST